MHENHRDRLKNRFLTENLDTFEPHNVLELLLFYSIPQKDTNETAHRLIERFGSLSDVLDAPFEELIQVPGIKEHSATLLKLIPALSRRYMLDKHHGDEPLSSTEKIGQYFVLLGAIVVFCPALLLYSYLCSLSTVYKQTAAIKSCHKRC